MPASGSGSVYPGPDGPPGLVSDIFTTTASRVLIGRATKGPLVLVSAVVTHLQLLSESRWAEPGWAPCPGSCYSAGARGAQLSLDTASSITRARTGSRGPAWGLNTEEVLLSFIALDAWFVLHED